MEPEIFQSQKEVLYLLKYIVQKKKKKEKGEKGEKNEVLSIEILLN